MSVLTERDREMYRQFLRDVGFADDPDAQVWAESQEDSFLKLIAAAREQGRREAIEECVKIYEAINALLGKVDLT